MQSRANVSSSDWLKWAGGGLKEILGMQRCNLPSFLLASFLLSFCFIIVLLNFVREQANPLSPVINADKHVSENLLEVTERNVGRMRTSRLSPRQFSGDERQSSPHNSKPSKPSPRPHPLPPSPRSRQGLKAQFNVFIEP